ncbi:type II toxin-antitoxin system ParD family antitoxin [Rhizobium sp. RU36D]|uniref:type II toxin-antitoxin system ParD family antitoxin n=1 Tax=Rhizobium sp. RU36D TaxID=1907415 RepID=UPI0009D8FD28|nr:type II toxin-antitoxin system ParD family antitoxin [Rhizobium sp. RU36D]SMC92234.1 antitoxin ParD1/3/4 [Rhizobium sp. RU36D]
MNKPLQITLGEPFNSIIDAEIESGRFASAQEVVEASLRLLEEERAKYEPLRQALLEGEESGEPRHIDREEFKALMRERYGR